MALAHIRSGAIIQRFSGEKGWLTLEDGRKVSPPVEGFTDGNDAVVPIVEETVDTSTGPNTTATTEEIVEASRVLRRRMIRDLTQAEIDAARNSALDRLVDEVQWKAIFKLLNIVRANNGQQPVTVAQFKAWIAEEMG